MYVLFMSLVSTSLLIGIKCNSMKVHSNYNEDQLKEQLYKSLQHVKLFLAAVENRIKNERRVLRTFEYNDFAEPNNPGGKYKDVEYKKGLDIIEPSKVKYKFLSNSAQNVSKNIKAIAPHSDLNNDFIEERKRNMERVIKKWEKDRNAHTLNIPTLNQPVEIKQQQSRIYDRTVPTNIFPGVSPGVRKVVDKWIHSISKPGLETGSILTTQTGNKKSTTNVQYPQHLRDENKAKYIMDNDKKTKDNIGNKHQTEDPFGMDFEYDGTTHGNGFTFPTLQQIVNNEADTPTSSTRTPLTPYVQELIKQMTGRHVGYYTVFLTRFFEIISVMESSPLDAFTAAVNDHLNYLKSEHKLDSLGEPAISGLISLADKVNVMPGDDKKNYALGMTMVMVNIEVFIEKTLRDMLQTADVLYNQEEGENLFGTLEHLSEYSKDYPGDNKTAVDVAEEMLRVMLSPLDRLAGTRKRREFITALNNLIQEKFPELGRRRIVTDDFTSNTDEIETSQDYDYRRIMKLKNIARHKMKKMKLNHNLDRRKMHSNNLTEKKMPHRHPTKNTFKIKPSKFTTQNVKRLTSRYKHSLLHKIVEASSYSDEEKDLRANLYNAFQNKSKYFKK